MSLNDKMLQKLERTKPGWVFTRSDFLDLGTTDAIGMAIQRLLKEGKLRRAARGLYYLPRTHPLIGELSARSDAIAAAIARRDGIRLQTPGAAAANDLHLSDQVPARIAYDTDGPRRTVKAGRCLIEFRKLSPRKMAAAGTLSGLLMQAFRNLGKEHITPARMEGLKRTLPAKERRRLLKDLRLAPAWMHPLFRELAGEL